MGESVLSAYALDGAGGGEVLTTELLGERLKSGQLVWVHLDVNHPDTRNWLEHQIGSLDEFVIDNLLEDETRPRVTRIGEGIVIFLRGVNLNPNSDPEDMVSMRLWIDKRRIISLRRRRLKAVGDIQEQIQVGHGPMDAGDFICMLVALLFERMDPVLTTLDETTDDIEEMVLESADVELRQSIIDVRKQAIMFRRYMAPQRDAIGQLRMADVPWLDDVHRRHLQESYNHVTRYLEDLDAIRERAQIVKDELANIFADKLNRNMYILSVISAIFLPLGFLTGLLGINVGGIPGAENNDAFLIFCGLLAALVLTQIIVIKRLKWF